MRHFHFLLTLARHLDAAALMAGFTVGFVFLALFWLVPEFRPEVRR